MCYKHYSEKVENNLVVTTEIQTRQVEPKENISEGRESVAMHEILVATDSG